MNIWPKHYQFMLYFKNKRIGPASCVARNKAGAIRQLNKGRLGIEELVGSEVAAYDVAECSLFKHLAVLLLPRYQHNCRAKWERTIL